MWFGAFVTVGARRLCREFWLARDTLELVNLLLIDFLLIFFITPFSNGRGVHGYTSAAGLVVMYA